MNTAKEEPDDLHINIYGRCPVQAEGTYRGREFYFRARGTHWHFELDTGLDKDGVKQCYLIEGKYDPSNGTNPYVAGYMPEYDAYSLILESLRKIDQGLVTPGPLP